MSLIIFIILLAVLILVHELGHFSVAKLFNIRVDEFGIGFPPRLLYKKFGETIYSVNLLFFGGFVKIFGENGNEAAQNPRSFAHKPRIVQAAVVVAGIVMNLLFAWGALSVGYMVGLPTSLEHIGIGQVRDAAPTIVAVYPDSPAQKGGMEAGDIVESVQTGTALIEAKTLNTNQQADVIRNFIAQHGEESMVVTVRRGSSELHLLAKPVAGLIEGHKALGIQLDDVGILQLPPHLALYQGGLLAYDMTIATAQGLAMFAYQSIHGTADYTSVAGPIGIAQIGSKAVQNGFSAAITLIALISINLAVINLVPIPGLDGGRLFIILIESIIRRPVPERYTSIATITGFALLIALMLFVSYHDIARLIG
jgi:regulator of sigma E protease